MELDKAIKHAIDGNALLFVGAGYSCNATNLLNKPMKMASEISKDLCEKLEIPPNENLSIVSDIFLKNALPKDLIEVLKDNYISKKVEEHHRTLSSINWNRVYTTNYDDVFEKASSEMGKRYTPVTLVDNPRNYKKSEIVIHINGYIKSLIPEKLNNEFKLTSTSYLVDDFKNSPWLGLFHTDVNNARAIFFVGASFKYDFDLQKVLASNPELRERIIFIDQVKSKAEIDFYENYNKELFGEVYYIGTNGLAEEIEKVRKTYKPKSLVTSFKCFTYLNNIKYEYQELTTQDIWKMLIYGNINRQLIYNYMEQNEYVFQREVIKDTVELLSEENTKCIVVHSDLGNGKTCIIECLCNLLRKKGHVFMLKDNKSFIGEEIENIDKLSGNKYIVIENYNYHFDILKILKNYMDKSYKLILTSRSYVHESTFRELLRVTDLEEQSVYEQNVNKLKHNDCSMLVDIINKVELWKEFKDYSKKDKVRVLKRNYDSQLSNILIDLIESETVRKKIDDFCKELIKSEKIKELLTAICINSISNLELNLYDMITILEIKGINAEIKLNKFANELINFGENIIVVKSPIIARYIIKNNILSNDALSIIKKMVHNSNKFDSDKKSESVRKALISCSNLWLMIDKKDESIKENIIIYYDELKDYFGYKKNPFFWLQYGIACLDIKEYGRAYNYFMIAYKESEDKTRMWDYHFDNFQINTQYARYLLEKEIYEGNCEEPFKIIEEAHKLLYGNFKSTKTLYHYIFKQVPLYVKFFDSYGVKMNSSQKNQYMRFIDEMVNKIDEYEVKKEGNIEKHIIRNKILLIKCKRKILTNSTNADNNKTIEEVASSIDT